MVLCCAGPETRNLYKCVVNVSGEGDGVFLYAELATTWEPAKSEAIEKAIRVLIDYFEYSYPLDSSKLTQFKLTH